MHMRYNTLFYKQSAHDLQNYSPLVNENQHVYIMFGLV
ncbi:hypothetical protein Mpsy_0519 [Methanolobus psychrophilus R15]|nr:hypothetical protein Mpsy_0519 [Methanolobus psychrophilus R15]